MLNWKKKYFNEKYRGVEKMILDLEFKRFKTQEIREEIREEYDSLKAKIDILTTQIKNGKGPDLAKMKDSLELMKRDSERFIAQMKALDLEVNGSKQTNEYPEGVQGINQQLDSLRELLTMLEDYKKGL